MYMIKNISPIFITLVIFCFFSPLLGAYQPHNTDTRDERGRTDLMKAVWQDNAEAVRGFLSSGADVNLRDQNGQTPLYLALQFNCDETILNLLLQAGARVDIVDLRGRSPFEILINRGSSPHFMTLLLQAGDLPSLSSTGDPLFFTALDAADDQLKIKFLEILYEADCSLDVTNSSGRNPEEEALARDDSQSADTLAALRVRLNDSFIEALDYEGREMTLSEVQSFLDRGARPAYRNVMGYNPCHYVVAAGRPDLLQLLLNHDPKATPFKDDPRVLQNKILFFPLEYDIETAIPLMTLLLDQGLPVNTRYEQGQTLLSRCIRHSPELASLLIKKGADPNALDPGGVSPLMAVLTTQLNDDGRLLKTLAAAGADLHARDAQGWDVLTYALLYHQSRGIIETLVTLGVNPESRDDYGTPGFFWAAAFSDNPGLVSSLISDNNKALWRDKDGWTPLMGALHFGNSPEVVALLAKETHDGRIKDGYGRSLAEFKSEYEMTTPYTAPPELDRLIRARRVYPVDAIPRGGDLDLALMEVIRWGDDPVMAEALIEAGADPNSSDDEGFNALMTASAYSSIEMVRTLIRRGASVFDVTSYGWTAFHLAAWSSDPGSIALFLEEGWDVNVRDFENWTPLMWVLRNQGSPETVRLLLEAGADTRVKTYRNESALHLACSAWLPPYEESLEMILKAGSDADDINGINNKGETALMLAASMGYQETCRLLLDKGADPAFMDKNGHTASTRALNNGHFEVAELFED